ncbi:hypothetical protein [Pricia antarctica]|nr:hypothetical protein [Pricia antarctica]
MKKYTSIITVGLALFCISTIISQQRAIDIERNSQSGKKYTLIARFEPELALSASEREHMEAERFAEIKLKMQLLDTMDISDRKRDKLISDLIEKSFRARSFRNMANNHFEEEK